VGKLLLKHPLSIRALLGHMYKPGATRINLVGTKNKCARLVALAVLEAQEMAFDDIYHHKSSGRTNADINRDEEIDEVALTRMIVQGTQLCEQLETMISFSVTIDTQSNVAAVSPGQKLCTLALKCAPVALGTIMWAREFTHPSEFAQSASFPTISPSVMSLVRLIAVRHPFTRSDALHVAVTFLRHSNPDISYQKVNSLKEQALRILLCLLVEGDVVPVLSSVTSRLSNTGTSELDASLVRYFVGSILEVVRPPYSPVFLRLFGQLLHTPKTIDAVRSTYFANDSRKKLEGLLQSLKLTKVSEGKLLEKGDNELVTSLLATYQIE
jgi:TH1 protein